MLASFFQECIETVSLANGGYAYIQRPKSKREGAVQSVDDLPDDLSVSTIAANSTQLYRISIEPIDVGP